MIELSSFLLLIFFGIILPLLLVLFVLFSLLVDFFGAPFVPTSNAYVLDILERANLKTGQNFYELGSGDGRVTREAVRTYKVNGLGVDLHPFLSLYSNLISKIQRIKVKFKQGNFYNISLKDADVIFVFLLPKTLKKLKHKFLSECKVGTLIISHGFKIEGFDKYLTLKIERKVFNTYYYKL